MKNQEKTTGLIIKCVGGLYSVESPGGVLHCRAKGIFRNKGISPCAGDYVCIEDGVISEVYPRRNSIIRPLLANLDQLVFVVSSCRPSPNYLLLDKFIAIAEYKQIIPVIAATKTDLAENCEMEDIYGNIGIKLITVNYSDENSINEVREILENKISAFTGNSGTGKSTLLNAVDPSLSIPTAEISEKLGRGRHTTRHAALYKLSCGGYIADTPGFSTFETKKYDVIKKDELCSCFREFSGYTDGCRFKDCSHTCEKGCAVLAAVQEGKISQMRHRNYCIMYEEAKQIKDWEL